MFYSLTRIFEKKLTYEKHLDVFGIADFIGIVVFCFEGVGTIFDIRHSMKKP